MSQATIIDFVRHDESSARSRIADLLSKGIFGFLVFLVVFAAIPYGTVEPWWKAAFVCFVFGLGILAIIETLLLGVIRIEGGGLIAPLLALSAYAFMQTISWTRGSVWNAISADAYQTRFVALQLLALALILAMLYRYASTTSRIRILIHVVLAVAAVSAIFGILRQTMQHSLGFGLPLLKPDQGYGQFINKNHFAFLMEMGFGLAIGLIVGGGVRRERVLMYVAFLLPIWTGLVLSNSRGGILAMLVQVIVAALIITSLPSSRDSIVGARFFSWATSLVARAVIVAVLIVGILGGVLWVGGDRLIGSLDSVTHELNPQTAPANDGATRNEIWRASWRMFKAHPVLGVGLGGYWIAITSYHQASGTLTPQEAHNEYLELLSSGGLVGFALGVWFAIALFRKVRQQLSVTNQFRRAVCFGATLGITGVAIHSLVDFGLHMLANALVFLVLVMMATTERPSRNRVLR